MTMTREQVADELGKFPLDKFSGRQCWILSAAITHLRQPAPTAQGELPPIDRKQIEAHLSRYWQHQWVDFDGHRRCEFLISSLLDAVASIATAQAAAGVPPDQDAQIMTIGEAAKSVGAWQDGGDESGYVHFGSWMAVHAFVLKMQAPLRAALMDVAHSKPVTANPAQMLRFVQGTARDALAAPSAPAQSDSADARDAKRYRWLRDNAVEFYPSGEGSDSKNAYLVITGYESPMTNEEKDIAIDAAIAASAAKGEQTI